MTRSFEAEIMEMPGLSDEAASRAFRDLTRIHRWLGDTATIARAIRRDPRPVRSVLDIGCGAGEVLREIRRNLGVYGIGVDLKRWTSPYSELRIVQADAVHDRLPRADVAFSMYLGHHLPEAKLIDLIRNVGRYCRRFILLDLVRHPLPLALFRMFVAPFVSPVVVRDGQTSIRRAFTRSELSRLAAEAVAGTNARFHHYVAPLYARQIVDISYTGEMP